MLGVKPTPYQQAICRVAFDGGEVGDDPLAQRAFGAIGAIPAQCRKVFAAVCGARAGKSYVLTSLPLLWKSLTVPLTTLAPGQQAAAMVVAPSIRLARETYRYALGAAQAHPELRKLLSNISQDAFLINRPDGIVSFECAPATSGGAALRGRSLVAAAMDECAFFRDEKYSVNDRDIFRAITPRLLEGGILVVPSTPWIKSGLLYDLWQENHTHPETSLVAHAPTELLRPTMAALVRQERQRDPENAAREYDAEFMESGAGSFFEPVSIELATNKALQVGSLRPKQGCVVTVGADFAFRSDCSALVVVHQYGQKRIVADIVELKPKKGEPLRPSEVVETFAKVAKEHKAEAVVADGHYRESIAELLSTYDLGFISAPQGAGGKALQYQCTRTLLRDGLVTIPDDPRLISQLKEVQYRATSGGGVSIASPRYKGGGHGDICSALVLALYRFGGFDFEKPEPQKGTREWNQMVEQRLLEAHLAKFQKEQRTDWWDVLGDSED